ncbi:ArsR/SmtB family transcription factor [Enterococcus timonensis]|uniref:ArsR/SmtB family transcription factor n=1 Tax=Enterococcus timonensis TaxID=1852364 RepID=UPI0008D960CD|nr:ArsR family transcriptional regulator [Enterococcus timonensis]
MYIKLDEQGINTLKTLASDTRIEIIKKLSLMPASVTEIAKELKLSKSIVSRHMRMLEDSKLIKLQESEDSMDNRIKRFHLVVDHIEIDVPQKIHLPYKELETEIKLGYYSDFLATPTCGLASSDEIIGDLDDPRSFVSDDRIRASLLWFSDGFVEYIIPNHLPQGAHIELLELSLELSSEFPESNDNWPSDISFFINDIDLGFWTAPGNFSDVRGSLTPNWWASEYSQYGILKHIRVTNKDTGIDGKKISSTTLDDLNLNLSPFIKVKIGINENAKNKGGLTIFGKDFGNHVQNAILKLFYS